MKIALYYPWIYTKGGGEKVVLEILKRSKHDIDVFCNLYDPKNTFEGFRDYKIEQKISLPIKGYLFRGGSFFLAASLTKLPLKEYDVFLVSTGGIGEFITFRNHEIPTIAYCHTPLRIIHDSEFRKMKFKEMGYLKKTLYRFGISFYSFFEKRAWESFDYVLANSKNTKERITKGKLFPEDKIEIIHPGADIEHFTPGKYKSYFLYPSRFTPYKRQKLAIEAFLEFKRKEKNDFKLILAGSVSEDKKEYFKEVKELADKHENIKIKTNVPGKEWVKLYQNAYSILFTAINEDWGIVPIEAGACKKPVIAVDEGGPKESIINGETGFLVDDTPGSIAEAMLKLSRNKKKVKEMGKKGLKEAKKYTWKDFVKRIDERIEKVMEV